MKNTQCKMILQHLLRHGRIDKRESEQLYGCERLAARIEEIRKLGYSIVTNRSKVLNRFGKAVYVADYVLEMEDQRRLAI